MKTLYSVLGVDPSADQYELETAFERLKAHYPQNKLDKDENARIQFQGISQAFKTLSNPASRAAYDRRLAGAGVSTISHAPEGDDSSWVSTRNIAVAGLIVLLLGGMWFYHVRQQAKLQKEIAERTMRLVEEEKKRLDEMRDADEQRRQEQAALARQRQDEARDRQMRADAAASVRDAQMQSRQVESQAAMMERQKQSEQLSRQRTEQMEKQRVAMEAERRLQNEKQQLRSICMQRYNRPDC